MLKCVLQYIDKMRMLVPEFWEYVGSQFTAWFQLMGNCLRPTQCFSSVQPTKQQMCKQTCNKK